MALAIEWTATAEAQLDTKRNQAIFQEIGAGIGGSIGQMLLRIASR
jgi:hypothetical protein